MRRRSSALSAATAAVFILAACAGGQNVNAIPAVKLSKPVADFQEQLVRVVDSVSPAVVQIQTTDGLGSGVVYDTKGNIITNAHVVGTFKTFKITLANGTYDGTLVGSFPADDLAVVHVKGTTPRPAPFADSSKLDVGDFALAIGNPLGLRSSVTEGIVSSLGRTVSEGNGVALPSAIQTSAAINPGNSGGALVDLRGRVIGIPTLAALDPQLGGAQAPGIGFAIPSNVVRRIAEQLIAKGHVVKSGRAYLGVRVATIVGGGVLVAAIVPGGPRRQGGDQARRHRPRGQRAAHADGGRACLRPRRPPAATASTREARPTRQGDHRHGDAGRAPRLTLPGKRAPLNAKETD